MLTDPNRVKEIFLEAAERRGQAARIAYLDRACGNDAELRNRVEALLRSHDKEGSFLDAPAAGPTLHDSACEVTLERAPSSDREVTLERTPTSDRDISPIAHDNEESEGLEFLTPSTRPDSLGRIGHYEVLEVLGKGGFGIVFRAFDETLHRVVAVKVLAPGLAATSPARKRFLREARSSAKVRHENIVQVYAVVEQPLPYLVMEFIPGETLQQRIDRTGPIETLEVLQLGRQIAEGLAAAHAQGLIHRDIKPGNILIEAGANPHAKITDFGLARAADDASITQSGCIAGTPMYMAPEQALGEAIDQRADLFSLGSVLYKMCSGRPPFRAPNTIAVLKRVVEDTPRPIQEIIPEVPEWLCDLITRLHAKNPADRTTTAQDVADLLARRLAEFQVPGNSYAAIAVPRPAEAKAPPVKEPVAPAPIVRRSAVKKRRWMAAAAVIAILFSGLGLSEATGVTDFRGTVIRLLSPEGTLVVEVDDPGVSVRIDGSDIVITGAGAKEIRLKPGRYTVEASKDGKLVKQELVSVTRNGRQVVRVSKEALPPGFMVATPSAETAAWEGVVTALSAPEQVKAVSARLKKLNPGFDGTVVPTIENGVVREVEFHTDDVTDISPVRALTRLRALKCTGFGDRNSPLTDLSPLSGLPLRTLVLAKGELFDLSPLRGMPLTEFKCYGTRVNDLSPLKGMNLRTLNCDGLHVSDLSPLKGMPLENLDLTGTQAEDLTALAGMKLEGLSLERTKISDLSPLKGMPLTSLNISSTPVADLSPLKGMKLTFLHCGGTKVSDLSPLNGMPLTHLNCDGTNVGDANLASIKDCKNLDLLVLSNTQVSDAGLAHLTDFSHLRRLQLFHTKVSDLAPLKNLSVEEIRLTPANITPKGIDILRNMKGLKTIGTDWNQAWPAAEFWARYDKGEFR